MEALGGDRLWFDRFLGYHAAILYYWVLVSGAMQAGDLVEKSTLDSCSTE